MNNAGHRNSESFSSSVLIHVDFSWPIQLFFYAVLANSGSTLNIQQYP
jgi:hypothetical protein